MGDRLTEDDKPKQTSLTPYGDIFDEALPHYMAMGMTYSEFWDGEYGTKRACREAYRIRMENERRLADMNNWYMGQYLIDVLNCTPLLVAGLNVKRGAKLPEYPEKPYLEKLAEQKKEENRRKQEEDQAMRAMAMMQAVFTKFNKRFEQKQQSQQAVTG